MSTLNRDEKVRLVTDALGFGTVVEVYQTLDNEDDFIPPVEWIDENSPKTVAECKKMYWQAERNSKEASYWIKRIADLLLAGPYYTPRPLGIGVKASIEIYR